MARQENEQQTPRSQQGSLARRGQYDPLGFVLSRGDLNPFSLMRRMTDEMDRMFGQVAAGRGDGSAPMWAPPVEISQREGQLVIRADLPGTKPEDVKLEVNDDTVVIQGERKQEREENKGDVHITERRYGRFYRAIVLPDGANAEQARARFENGVLEITVPVQQQQQQPKQIPIEGSTGGGKNESGQTAGNTEKAA